MKNIRVREAASYCGVSKSYLDKLRMGDDGPIFFRLGRSVVYSTGDLDSWIDSKRPHANDDNAARAAA